MQNCQKDDDQSFAACTKIIDDTASAAADRAAALISRGRAWHDVKHDYDHAIADYSQAISLDPDNSVAFYDRGVDWRAKGNDTSAIADYDEAIRLNPKYEYAYVNRGLAWHSKGNDDRAIADYDQAARLDPKDADAYYYRGDAWYAKGDHDRAIANYTETIQTRFETMWTPT